MVDSCTKRVIVDDNVLFFRSIYCKQYILQELPFDVNPFGHALMIRSSRGNFAEE